MIDLKQLRERAKVAAVTGTERAGVRVAAADLLALIDATERQQWVPVGERLPEGVRSKPVLVYAPGAVGGSSTVIDFDRYCRGRGWRHYGVTHWMPLPEQPPADARGGREKV